MDGLFSVADQMYVDGDELDCRRAPYSTGIIGNSGVLWAMIPPCVQIELLRDITNGVVMTFHHP